MRLTRHAVPALTALTLLLAGCGTGRDHPSAGPAGGNDPSVSTSSGPDWIFLQNTAEDVDLDAGRYALTWDTADQVAVVTAPAGYQQFGGWTFVSPDGEGPFHAMGYLQSTVFFGDPCGSRAHPKRYSLEALDTVPAIAGFLAAQKGALTSDPRPATIDGHEGLVVDYRLPDIDVAHCEEKAWDIMPGWWLGLRGERARIWVIDLDGQPVLLAWVADQRVRRGLLAEMTRMVESTEFVDPD